MDGLIVRRGFFARRFGGWGRAQSFEDAVIDTDIRRAVSAADRLPCCRRDKRGAQAYERNHVGVPA
jgi:hypothetical protein